jgi:hypothetical protein
MRAYATLLLGWILLSTLWGCGGGSSKSTPSTPTITSVTIAPKAVSLQTGQMQQFTATVTGTGNFDPSVQWFVDGVNGGNSTVGTISGGQYTAPAQPPNPSSVTIQATASADSSKLDTAQATIRAILAPTVVWPETNLSLPGGDDGEATETPPGITLADDGAGGAFVLWEHRFPVDSSAALRCKRPTDLGPWRYSSYQPLDRVSGITTCGKRRRGQRDRRLG